jgi:adenylate cyclase
MAGSQMKRRLTAILAADVVGYTKMIAADDSATVAALDSARQVIRENIEAQDARVVDMAGDSVLAVFETATGATEAALAIQEALDGRDMQFRIGVHLGEVIEKPDGTVYGDGVNLAARLEGLAAPGGVCISAAVVDQVTNKLDASFDDIGAHMVKNVAKPIHAFAWGGISDAARATDRRKPTVALGAFEAKGGIDADALTDGVAAAVATSLSNQTGIDFVSDSDAAEFVVSATLQVRGERYRAALRILERASGSHIVADRFDGTLEEPFAAEDALAYRLYNAIRFGLHRHEQESGTAGQETDEARILEAGRLMFRPFLEDFQEAGRLLDIVLANDPRNFMALAMRAGSLSGEFFGGYRDVSEDDKALAYELAQEAVRLNGASDYAHWILSGVHLLCRGDHAASEAESEICLELNPYYGFATIGLGLAAITGGKVEDGIAQCSKVAASDPRSQLLPWAAQSLALGHLVAGRYDEAVAWAQRADRRQADAVRTLLILAAASALAGNDALAGETMRRIMVRHPDFRIADFGNWPFKHPEPADRLTDGLRRAGLPV